MNPPPDRLALTSTAVDEIFAGRVARSATPSSVYAVFDRRGLVYGNGFAAPGHDRPTIDTAYRIASCTKSFTAAAALLLRDRGALALTDPIDAQLPLGPLLGVAGSGAVPTIGQLLSMAGGLPTDDPWADRQESLTGAEFDALIAAGISLVRSPGSGYEYSNLGYALVGRAIASAAGRPYIEFVTDELLGPLGLDQIGYHTGLPAADGVAVGHQRVDDEWVPLPFSGPGAFSPIGGLFATARDLIRWVCWLAAARADDADDLVLARSSRREMCTVQTPTDRGGYGYGLVVEDSARHGRILAHSGGYPGFGAHLRWHDETGIGILALENATYSGPYRPATEALALILDHTATPAVLPELWPATLAAREAVESLLRQWDPALVADLLADNVALDEPLQRRRETIERLAAAAGIAEVATVPLLQASPRSDSPAHLAWTSPGSRGSLRCEIRLTPTAVPLVQTLAVTTG